MWLLSRLLCLRLSTPIPSQIFLGSNCRDRSMETLFFNLLSTWMHVRMQQTDILKYRPVFYLYWSMRWLVVPHTSQGGSLLETRLTHRHTTAGHTCPAFQSQSHIFFYVDTSILLILSNRLCMVIFTDLALTYTHTMSSSAVFLKLQATPRGNVIQLMQNEWESIFRNSPPHLITTKTDISPSLTAPSLPLSLLFVWLQNCLHLISHHQRNLSVCQTSARWSSVCWLISPLTPSCFGFSTTRSRTSSPCWPLSGQSHTHTQKHARVRCDLLSKVNVDSPQENLSLPPPTSYC